MAAYWLAKEAKIFEKHGLSVDVVLIESGVTTVQALTAGETQIAMGGGTVAVSSNLAGSDIVSISSIESRMPYALLAQKEIKTIEQLKGKRLAVSRFGSASDLAARVILQRYGLTPDKDVTILQTGGTSTTLPAFWSSFSNYPDKIRSLLDVLREISPEKLTPSDKVETLLKYYHPIFKKRYDDYTKRKKDLEMFQQITERYRSLNSLLADLVLEPANESVTDISAPGTDDEKLVLSTIHSAKGLEWHSVFVIYALEGRFPITRAATSEEAMEEERRLMYVACTSPSVRASP